MNKNYTICLIIFLTSIIIISIFTPIFKNIFKNKIIEGADTRSTSSTSTIYKEYIKMLKTYNRDIGLTPMINDTLSKLTEEEKNEIYTLKETSIGKIPVFNTKILEGKIDSRLMNILKKAFTSELPEDHAEIGVYGILGMIVQSMIYNLEQIEILPKILTS